MKGGIPLKAKGRVELYCYKKMDNGIMDQFTVIVMEKNKSDAKREYERQGYKVVG
jgi:hypothetical protein